MSANNPPLNPWLAAVIILAVLAGVAAVLLGVSAGQEAASYSPDVRAVASLTTWSNYLLVVAAVALVGAMVMEGVRWSLRQS